MYEALASLASPPKSVASNNNGLTAVSKFSSNIANNTQVVWDGSKCGTGIEVSEGGSACFLKEQSYLFRTIATSTGFTGGINYWEIIADSRT